MKGFVIAFPINTMKNKFILPDGMLGGDFIVFVDAVTEKVKDVEIQR